MLRVGTTNFTPWIRLYGPDGALVGEASPNNSTFNRDASLNLQATNSGTYTVVVSATFAGQAGTYGLNLALIPTPIVLAPGDEGGSLINGRTNAATLNLGDLHVWS